MSPSPYEVSKERGKLFYKRGFASLKLSVGWWVENLRISPRLNEGGRVGKDNMEMGWGLRVLTSFFQGF